MSQYQNQMNSGIGTQFQNPATQTGVPSSTLPTGTVPTSTMPTGGGVPYTPTQTPYTDGATIPGQTPNLGQITTPQLPNLSQLGTQYPTTAQQPVDLGNQNSGWTAVNPPAASDTPVLAHPVNPAPPTTPTAPTAPSTPATPAGDITVTTTYDGVSTTVTMPVGTQTDVTLVDPTNGSQVHEHIAAGVS
jgi:hypothetical protein